MNDNALFAVVRQLLLDAFTAQGVSLPGGVIQANQTKRHGVQDAATLYFFKVSSRRLGGVQVASVPAVSGVDETSRQQYETVVQFEAWVPQTDSPTERTAADYVELAADILATPSSVEKLAAQGVGILRITDIRNPYFVDDRDQNSASPSFDLTLTHKRAITTNGPGVDHIEAGHFQV